MYNLIELLQNGKVTIRLDEEGVYQVLYSHHSDNGDYVHKSKTGSNLPQLLSEMRNKL